MRLLFKLLMKFMMFAAMVLLMGSGLKRGSRLLMGGSAIAGADGSPVSSEESDLMSTVFQSALRLVSGTASRSELAGELSDKLYAGRANSEEMAELGIEVDKPKKDSSAPGVEGLPGAAKPDGKSPGKASEQSPEKPDARSVASRAASRAKKGLPAKPGGSLVGTDLVSGKSQSALDALWKRLKPYTVEMSMVPVVFLGMVLVSKVRRRKREEPLVPEFAVVQTPADSEPYDMEHAVHALDDEEFALLVALIYQRQGYRVSLPSGLGGGRGGDFKLARKSERLLVKCEKSSSDHRVPVERVREFHEAVTDANATGGLYVGSCGFTWDARHFAKTRRIKLIDARTLDAQLTAAREKPDENLLTITPWVSKFMTKAEMTVPHCPECEVEMEQVKVSGGSVWLCTQRPECSGQRAVRKYQKAKRAAARNADADVELKVELRAEVKADVKADTKKADVEKADVKTDADAVDAPRRVVQRRSFFPVSASLPAMKPAPLPVERRAAIGFYADVVDPSCPAGRRNGVDSAKACPLTPNVMPPFTEGAGTGVRKDVVEVPLAAAQQRAAQLPEAQPATPEVVPSPVQTGGGGTRVKAPSALRAAFERRGFILQDDRPVAPKAVPTSAEGAGTGDCTEKPNALRSAFQRRGFHLPEDQPVTPDAAQPRRKARTPQR
jgi:ssDNA-binding Zn-finger/Zn-ribbon topoisomerase 1